MGIIQNLKKKIKINKDGSKIIPSGFNFNRVGGQSLDVNSSGALYVSYGKEDAARYIKYLGPTFIGKLLGTAHYNVQHISTKQNLKMPSDLEVAKITAELLLKNDKMFNVFNESFYSLVVKDNITKNDLSNCIKEPSGKESQKIAYAFSTLLGDPNYLEEAHLYYNYIRKLGYDVIPDLSDRYGGTSETAMIIINPDKIKLNSTTLITKDIMKAGKKYVKTLEKLKVSDILK